MWYVGAIVRVERGFSTLFTDSIRARIQFICSQVASFADVNGGVQ